MRGAGFKGVWKDRRGYTLPEVLTAVAVAGVLAAISLIIFLALLERWRVEAAADQLAADMRLAHTNATQQLTDWRVVLMHDGRPLAACSNADYCLVKLKNAYDGVDGSPALDPEHPPAPRELPEGTRIKEVTFDADCSGGDPDAAVPRAVAGPSPRGPSSSTPTGRCGPCARARAARSGSAPTTAARLAAWSSRPPPRGSGLARSSTSRHADETGSSLVEVSVAMVVLALAVVPLAGMLEAGLRAATSPGEYDSARALANEKLEEVRALPYSRPGGAADSAVERYAPPGPPDVTEGDLTVSVRTAFVDENLSGPANAPPTGQMRVEVLVTWDAGSYSTVGIVSGEPP